MSKYKVGDRFIVRIDEVLPVRNGYGEFTNYILNAEPPEDRKEIYPADGCVVTEKFLSQCSPFDIICGHERIETDKLLPCPFCGCKMQLEKAVMCDGRTIRYSPVGHHNRGCQLQFASAYVGNPTTPDGAIKKWNRRKNGDGKKTKTGVWFGTVCTACGESTSFYYDCEYCPHCGAKMDKE